MPPTGAWAPRCTSKRYVRWAHRPAHAPTTTCYAPENIGHHAALRQLANRLVGILHGCLKTNALYNESTAWQHQHTRIQTAAT